MIEKLDVDILIFYVSFRFIYCRFINGRIGEEEVGFGWMGLGFYFRVFREVFGGGELLVLW